MEEPEAVEVDLAAALFLVVGLAIGLPIVAEFNATGLVPRLPSALVAVSFCGLAALLLVCGLILDTVVKGNRRQWELEVTRIWNDAAERGERYS